MEQNMSARELPGLIPWYGALVPVSEAKIEVVVASSHLLESCGTAGASDAESSF
jgi:hypothetical protein